MGTFQKAFKMKVNKIPSSTQTHPLLLKDILEDSILFWYSINLTMNCIQQT